MKEKLLKGVSLIFFVLLGAGIGLFAGYSAGKGNISHWLILQLFISFILFYVLHIMIHEAGHGIFGALSGYKMVSYRVFSLMWVWQSDGKIRFRRYKVLGTLGQCLMAPPAYEKGKYPFRLYLMGGCLANVISSLAVGAVSFLFFDNALLLVTFVLVGLLVAITNAVPMGFNDGMSYRIASMSEEQQYLLYLQFELNNQTSRGKTYAELPEAYFDTVAAYPKHTYFNDAQAFMQAGRLQEKKDWPRLGEKLEALWQRKEQLIVIYQVELKKELLFFLCVTAAEDERIQQLWQDKLVKNALKQALVGNRRVEAAYYYFIEDDSNRALSLIEDGRALTDKAANAGDAKMELGLLTWLQEEIEKREATPVESAIQEGTKDSL